MVPVVDVLDPDSHPAAELAAPVDHLYRQAGIGDYTGAGQPGHAATDDDDDDDRGVGVGRANSGFGCVEVTACMYGTGADHATPSSEAIASRSSSHRFSQVSPQKKWQLVWARSSRQRASSRAGFA